MSVNLPSILFRVRASVSEISIDNMDDLTMYREVYKASQFVDSIKRVGVVDADLETPIVCLAAYYSHVNYTLLNARQLGTIDESVIIRQNELKRIARAMLQQITDQPLDANLAVDDTRFAKIGALGYATTTGVMNDPTW